jgi:hypothetical protein
LIKIKINTACLFYDDGGKIVDRYDKMGMLREEITSRIRERKKRVFLDVNK